MDEDGIACPGLHLLMNLLNVIYTGALGVHELLVDPWPTWLADGQCGGLTWIVCTPS